jgi:hypothetical protein
VANLGLRLSYPLGWSGRRLSQGAKGPKTIIGNVAAVVAFAMMVVCAAVTLSFVFINIKRIRLRLKSGQHFFGAGPWRRD